MPVLIERALKDIVENKVTIEEITWPTRSS